MIIQRFLSLLLFGILLISGFAHGQQPDTYVQRGELATALILARNPDVPKIKNTGQYPDVQRGDVLEPYLLAAAKFGILTPDAKTGKLKPEGSVTRAEFLKMLTQTFGMATNMPNSYTDVPNDSWFAPYVGLAQTYQIFNRTDNGHLDPAKLVLRNEALEALRIFLRLRQQPDDAKARIVADEQSKEQLTLYSIISTRRTKVVLVQKPQPVQVATPAPTPVSLPQLRTDIVQMVNEIRLTKNLKPLHYNQLLENSAQAYAERMANEGFFGHVSPDGQTLKDRVGATGYYDRSFSDDCNCVKGFTLGENLARGQKTAQEVMDAWMKSPDHRAAILNADYTDIGIGVKAGVWVQHFGGILLPGQKILGSK